MSSFISTLTLLILLSLCPGAIAEPKPFHAESFQKIEANNLHHKWLLVIWATDCPPCHLELEMISKLKAKYNNLKIELIASDSSENHLDVQRVLQNYNLAEIDTWHYAVSNSAALRHSIDSTWRGEIPRSYFYQANGNRCAVSGTLSRASVLSWLKGSDKKCTNLSSKT